MEPFETYLIKLVADYRSQLSKFDNLTVLDLTIKTEHDKVYRSYIESRMALNVATKILTELKKRKMMK